MLTEKRTRFKLHVNTFYGSKQFKTKFEPFFKKNIFPLYRFKIAGIVRCGFVFSKWHRIDPFNIVIRHVQISE